MCFSWKCFGSAHLEQNVELPINSIPARSFLMAFYLWNTSLAALCSGVTCCDLQRCLRMEKDTFKLNSKLYTYNSELFHLFVEVCVFTSRWQATHASAPAEH